MEITKKGLKKATRESFKSKSREIHQSIPNRTFFLNRFKITK